MRRVLLLGVLAAACGNSTKTGTSPSKKPLTAKEIVQQSSPAIVFVEVGDGDTRATGTGFIVDKSGLIATNFHVVRGNKTIKVKLYGGAVYPVTQIAGVDPGRDLAVIRIQPAKALPTIRLGDSDAMVAGDQIVTIGNPLGVFDYTVSSGLVSQIRPVCTADMVTYAKANQGKLAELAHKPQRELTEADKDEIGKLICKQELTYFQISAPISQGSSGGPLFNQAGEVVGVTTAIISAGQNINLAIPTNYLKPIVHHPESISLDEFAQGTKEQADDSVDHTPIERKIPNLDVSALSGCSGDQVLELEKSIWGAFGVGAPLYNAGNMEACYRIYEGLATKLEQTPPCKGVKIVFGDGLLRAGSLDYRGDDAAQQKKAYKLKAWAMRDTFDGLLDVAKRWRDANPAGKRDEQKPPPTIPPPPKEKKSAPSK